MGNFGERMQREREMRGITLEEIAEATKIGTRSLRALEAQEFSKLPGGIFNKGFVRAYAKYLGIDEEQAVADYSEALAEAQAAGLLGKVDAQNLNAELHSISAAEEPDPPPSGSFAAVAIVILVLVALGVGGWTYYTRYRTKARVTPSRPGTSTAVTQNPTSQPAPPILPPASTGASAVSTPAASTAAGSPAKTPADAASTQSPAKPSSPPASLAAKTANPSPDANPAAGDFEFRIRARESSWISLTVDGRQVMEGNLSASSEKSFRAHQQVVMKTGNAGALEVSLNGKPQPSLGDPNQVRTLTFTAEGIRQ